MDQDQDAEMDDDQPSETADHSEMADPDDSFIESPDEITDEITDELDGLSMDDLGAAYARVAAEHDPEAFAHPQEEEPHDDSSESEPVDDEQEHPHEQEDLVTPEAIVEAALFVGHPENKRFTAERLASLMRDVSPEEVVLLIDQLNESYREADQGLRIIQDEQGYRMSIAPEVEAVRRSFLGKVRETRLSQTAIEVLSLVAYQPGITAQKVQDQRGRESGPLLNQLVRRQLLRMERIKPAKGGRAIPHYHPTERFLVLFGLDTLEDLPHVDEALRES
ncbi:SMC-Scp complex subunit ScpB [bacterium]|nr:SMC-Scp complex subunit ScpB [bacterium]